MKRDVKVALALGGGGAKGVAHLGVLKVLQREGIEISAIAGTSAGSLIGAAYCSGMSLTDLEAEVLRLTKPGSWSEILSLGNIKNSLIGNADLLRYINHLLKEVDFQDLQIPLRIVTTNLADGREVILKTGSVAEAVLASSSIPGVLAPVLMNDQYLIDGGVANQTPVSVAEAMGADLVIAVDLMHNTHRDMSDPNIIEVMMQSYEIIRSQSVKYSLDKALSDYILIQPVFGDLTDTFKFQNIREFIEAGEQAAIQVLSAIRSRIKT